MKKFLLAAAFLGLSATPALAAMPGLTGNAYVVAQFLSSSSDCQGFKDGVAPLGLTATCDTRDEGYRFGAGYYFNKYFGAEIGYLDGGQGKASGIAPNGAVVVKLKAPFTAFDFVGTARYEFLPDFTAIVRLGGAKWNYEVKTSSPTFGAKNDAVSFTWGLGLEYKWFTVGYDQIQH